ncbi:MAG: ABC transporter permease [Brevefilum sp.]
MRKLVVLAAKEVLVTFRDIGAIVTMLVTPLLLTLAIAAAFGTGGSGTLTEVPVLVVDNDRGEFSGEILEAFDSQSEEGLLAVEHVSDEATARSRVNADEVAALVIIPEDFSESILPLAPLVQDQLGLDLFTLTEEDIQNLSPEQQQQITALYNQTQNREEEPPIVEIYASADWQISTAVIEGVVRSVLERINMTVAGTNAIISSMIEAQISQGGEGLPGLEKSMGSSLGEIDQTGEKDLPINLNIVSPSGRQFNWLDYSAASMAILFLMFAVTSGGRTILAERQMGTLPRLVVTPTHNLTILLGKMAGIIATGLLQVGVLWGATSLIGAYWGDPLSVIITLLLLVLAATGVGALISAWAKTAGQAGAIGTAFTLAAAAASGSFFPRMNLPSLLRTISYISPNAWGIEIFARLQSGRTAFEILPWLGGLLALSFIYYAIAAFGFRRKFD